MSHPPTPEQQRAIDLFSTGESLVIEAGAGTGKTSTLLFLAQSTSRRGQGIVFNKPIQLENAAKFPGSCNWSTAHSLAYRSVGGQFEERARQGKRMRSIDIANRLGVDPLKVTAWDGEQKLLSSTFLAGLVMRAASKFCQTADVAPSFKHVPRVKGLDGIGTSGGPNNLAVAKHLEAPLKRAWADLSNVEGGLPFTKSTAMGVYLKLWQLSRPILGADYILFDEAQDANPVMVDVVSLQADPEFRASHNMKPAQIVWVGDSQQQIYGFTGAINALQTVPAEHRSFLTQSFRFGHAVAEAANHILSLIPSAELRLKGFDKITSTVGKVLDPSVILTRTNATAVRSVLEAQTAGKAVHLIGGGQEIVSFAKAARDLMDGLKVDHPELACFDSWGEVQEYVTADEQGGDLKLMVALIDEFTVAVILEALDGQTREQDADLVVSTAHKAKGREWDTVQIAGDFPEDRLARGDDAATDELRLLYVAVTRAKLELDIDGIPFLRDGYTPKPAPVAETVEQPKVARASRRQSEHVGTVGQPISFTARCTNAKGMTTRFGYTHLTRFIDADGNVFKAFVDEELAAGTTYDIDARVKAHGEFNGVLETTINYVNTWAAAPGEEVAV